MSLIKGLLVNKIYSTILLYYVEKFRCKMNIHVSLSFACTNFSELRSAKNTFIYVITFDKLNGCQYMGRKCQYQSHV